MIKWYRSDDESCGGTNTEDPDVDFEQVTNRIEVEEDENTGFSPEIERIVTQEDLEIKPHQEEMEIVNLGVSKERKKVKVGRA